MNLIYIEYLIFCFLCTLILISKLNVFCVSSACSTLHTSLQVNQEDKDHAATVIQSHVRGYFTRKQTHHEKPKDTEQVTYNQDEQENTNELIHDHNEQQDTNPLTDEQHHEEHNNDNEKSHRDRVSSPMNEVNAFTFHIILIINRKRNSDMMTFLFSVVTRQYA